MTSEIVKKRRKKLLEDTNNFWKDSPVSKKSIGTWIRAYHYTLPLYILFLIAYGSPSMVKGCYMFLAMVIMLFYYYEGCWLSLIEKEYLEDNNNITDWLIELFNHEINRKNRYHFSYVVFGLYCFTLLTITYLRINNIDYGYFLVAVVIILMFISRYVHKS